MTSIWVATLVAAVTLAACGSDRLGSPVCCKGDHDGEASIAPCDACKEQDAGGKQEDAGDGERATGARGPTSGPNEDCANVPDGRAYLDNCGACVGGDTGRQPCNRDCAGLSDGEAYFDNCGVCVGGNTGKPPCNLDCAGVADGGAYRDNCGVCVGGETGKEPCQQDCAGAPEGSAYLDPCGICVGGETGKVDCVKDCSGVWGGGAHLDNCGGCVGGDTGKLDCAKDCSGVWGGSAYLDNCGVCVGGDTGQEPCGYDCAGVPGGSAHLDHCGVCVGGTSGEVDCVKDCAGIWGGDATLDRCGQCNADPTHDVTACYDVALIFVKEAGQTASFARQDIEARVNGAIDDMIRANSYHAVGLRVASSSEWYELDASQFKGLATGSLWIDDLTVLTDAASRGELDLSGRPVVAVVMDDPKNQALVSGRALPYDANLTIGGTNFGTKRQLLLMGNRGEFLDKQRFYDSALYSSDLSQFYDNPCGDNLVSFDGVFAHELFHTHNLATHATTRACTGGPLLGVCTDDYFNMFDGLSSSRFFGTSLNAAFRARAGWLTAARTLQITSSGTYTLQHLNARSGPNSARIEVPGWDQVLWLEYRQPGPFDYGMVQASFAPVQTGLLLYADGILLDASGPGASINQDQQLLPNGQPREVALKDTLTVDPLGVTIEITSVDPVVTMPMDSSQCPAFESGAGGSISFEVTLTGLTPTRNNPEAITVPCGRGCFLPAGGEYTGYYQFWVSDIGYGNSRELPWEFEFIGLPAGVSYSNTPVQRQYPPPNASTYSGTPHSFITFRAEPTVASGSYPFLLRVRNPQDPSKYTDNRQVLNVP